VPVNALDSVGSLDASSKGIGQRATGINESVVLILVPLLRDGRNRHDDCPSRLARALSAAGSKRESWMMTV
jgi:hypothetical protein